MNRIYYTKPFGTNLGSRPDSAKQGKFVSGRPLPIGSQEGLRHERPKFIPVLPWNLIGEVRGRLLFALDHDVKLATAVPGLCVE